MDWPDNRLPPLVTIHPFSTESIGAILAALGQTLNGAGSATWSSANRALYIPFTLERPIDVVALWCWNGATAANNLDLGIYDKTGVRLVSTGTQAQAGINALQVISVSTTTLGPGLFYLAMAMDGTTGTVRRANISNANNGQDAGMALQATAFALPATATFASYAGDTNVPICGLSTRATL